MAKTKYTPPGWGKMTLAQKRVRIARDVIAQIRAGRFDVQSDKGYCNMDLVDPVDVRGEEQWYKEDGTWLIADENEKVVDRLKDLNKENCHVCALGGAMISAIKFDDGTTVAELQDVDSEDVREKLDKYFSRDQMDLIECAFEGTDHGCDLSDEETSSCVDFGLLIGDDADLLMAIMQNIIDHRGLFRPEVEYEVSLV